MRALNYLLCLAAVALTGCAGYQVGPVRGTLIAPGKSIEILPFNNQTLQPRLGDALTKATRERIQTDGSFRLATRDPGDVVVSGTITFYGRESLNFLSTDSITPENYRVGLIAHVVVRERVTGKLLVERDLKPHTLVHIGRDLASAERQSLPLIAADFARDLVSLLSESRW
jgi:hypothetical protein